MAGTWSAAMPKPQQQIFSSIWLGGRFNYLQLSAFFLFGPEMTKKINLELEEKKIYSQKIEKLLLPESIMV